MSNRQHAQSHGFSLVELSIVLVILGLLTGGILAGQSLIRASELRAVSTEYQRYLTATHAFRDKYFALPGDMLNATSVWGKDDASCTGHIGNPATPGTCNGNGNGQFNAGAASATGESFRFWQQLALAGLIEGTYSGNAGSSGGLSSLIGTNAPASKLAKAGWGVYYYGTMGVDPGIWPNFEGTYENQFAFGGVPSAGGFTEAAILRPNELWNIDTKLDDGKPGTGLVRTFEAYVNCHNAGTSTTVALAPTAEYRLNSTAIACMALFNLK